MKKSAHRALCVIAAVVGSSVSHAAEQAALRRYIEAEDCAGLLRYPYDNEDASGWYAREADLRAYGAPGRSFCAAIHENASPEGRTMSHELADAIPAGTYRVFLRTVGPRTAAADTVVRVQLGKASVDFRWREGGKRFVWQPGLELALKEPAKTVALTAAEFGGSGHGAMYEPLLRSIWIDTLYISGDLKESAPPNVIAERALRGGVSLEELGERPSYRVDDPGPAAQRTPEPKGAVQAKPVLLEAFDGRQNLWPDSSFELGMNGGWASSTGSVFTDADLSQEAPFHGSHCLRVQKNAFSPPYRLAGPGEVAVSVYVRGRGGKVMVQLRQVPDNLNLRRLNHGGRFNVKTILSASGPASEAWQRISVSGSVSAGWYYLSVIGNEFLVDAVQLERGSQPTPYAPRAELEGALRTGRLANILYDGQRTLLVWFHNSGDTPKDARLRYRVVDVRESAAAQGVTLPIRVKPGETVKRDVEILPPLRGQFSATYAVGGRKLPEGETVFLVMPEPSDKPTRHQLGANMNLGATALAVHSRMGLKWVLTCKSRELGSASEAVHRKPDEWTWHDGRAALPAKYGMGCVPCFWPGRIPEFMAHQETKRYRTTRGHRRPTKPKLDLWRDYVAEVADHYKGHIKQWCVDDEAECSWDPAHFAQVVNATTESVHANVPGVQVGLSAHPDFTEELLCHVPAEKIDFFGGSTFDFYYWEARKVRRLRERYGKPYYCYGVGNRIPSRTMYHTSYMYEPVYWNAARMARRMVNMSLAQDLTIPGHYAALIRNDGVHSGFNKPLCDYDGTPLAWGGTFGCVGTLLADAVPLGDIALGDTGRRVHLFRVGDRLGAVTWATFVKTYDHWWRPAERELVGLSLPCAQTSVEVLDMYWNPHGQARWERGALKLDLNEEPTFVMDKTLGESRFREMLGAATAAPRPIGMSMQLVPGRDGAVDLALTVANGSGADLRGVTLDFRNPRGRAPFSAAGEWLLRNPVAKVGNLSRGGKKTVRLATVLDGDRPYEDGHVRAILTAEGDVEEAVDDWLWLVPALRATASPSVDGRLDEWEKRSGAWLFYDWAWALFTRHLIQLHEGGEYFSYPPYRVDARGAFWAAWDAKNLYLATRLEDDQPILAGETSETVRLVVKAGGAPLEVVLTPRANGSVDTSAGSRLSARSSVTARKGRNGADAKLETIRSVNIETAIPWEALGAKPQAGALIGFDLFWTDADREGDEVVAGTLRWAGGANDMGYMLLRE